MKKYTFTKEDYFKSKLKDLEGKNNLPPNILEILQNEIVIRKIDPKTITIHEIKYILRKNKLNKYYSQVPSLYNSIRGVKSPDLTTLIKLNKETQNKKEQLLDINYKFDDCGICLDIITLENYKQLECKHIFHIKCIDQWLSVVKNCPYCREQVIASANFNEYFVKYEGHSIDSLSKDMSKKINDVITEKFEKHTSLPSDYILQRIINTVLLQDILSEETKNVLVDLRTRMDPFCSMQKLYMCDKFYDGVASNLEW